MISIWYYAIDKFATNIKQKRGRLFALRLIERVERYQNCKFCKKFFTDETVFNVYDSVYSFPLKFFVTGDVKLLLENLPKKKLQVSFRHHEPSLYAGSLAEFSYMRETISSHIDERGTTNICALLLLLFIGCIPCTGYQIGYTISILLH